MLREVRVSMPPATASAAAPPLRPLRKAAAAALRVLFRLGADAVLYGFLAALLATCLGCVVYVLGRWICGEGSAVEGAGGVILVSAVGVMMPLFLASFPLFLVRALSMPSSSPMRRRTRSNVQKGMERRVCTKSRRPHFTWGLWL